MCDGVAAVGGAPGRSRKDQHVAGPHTGGHQRLVDEGHRAVACRDRTCESLCGARESLFHHVLDGYERHASDDHPELLRHARS